MEGKIIMKTTSRVYGKNTSTITSRKPNISLSQAVKDQLTELKLIPDETYENVIKRIIKDRKEVTDHDSKNN